MPQSSIKHTEAVTVNVERAAEHLSQAVRFRTVSYVDRTKCDRAEFLKLHGMLEQAYPLVHKYLVREKVNELSLLYKWPGSALHLPILLTCHADVVPVEEGTESKWTHDPFAGDIADGHVWGRGTLDIKSQMIAIMEAVETLLSFGFQPSRDIYIAFGHDEEIGGQEGAAKISELLASRGVRLEWVLDEGGAVTEGAMKGVEPPIAFIGTCEKGYADIRITVKSAGGHSSTPPKFTALGALAEAITRVQENPMPPRLTPAVSQMLSTVGPYMPSPMRLVSCNPGLFRQLLFRDFSRNPSTNALVRTTFAPTMARASDAPNVLPQSAWAVVNSRILPGDSVQSVLDHLTRVLRGTGAEVELIRGTEPTRISDNAAAGYKAIQSCITRVFPGSVVTPYLVCGGTDARKYEPVAENIYRFSPYQIKYEDLGLMHGTNERISLENLDRAVRFYLELIPLTC